MDFGALTPSLANGSTSSTTNGKCDDEAKLDDGDGDDGDDDNDGDNDNDDDDNACAYTGTTTPPSPSLAQKACLPRIRRCYHSCKILNQTMLPLV